jgi:hypothetical protein
VIVDLLPQAYYLPGFAGIYEVLFFLAGGFGYIWRKQGNFEAPGVYGWL